MNKKLIVFTFLMLFAIIPNYAKNNITQGQMKPFRVALIIGDQWKDSSGYLISTKGSDETQSAGIATEPSSTDFHHLAELLKSWSIPFDIIRLDQQFLDRYMFLDMYNKSKYGAIIWDVNQSDKLLSPDYSIITEMVTDYHIGLIALADRITQPEIQSLLGLKYIGSWQSNTNVEIVNEYFLTKDVESPLTINNEKGGSIQRQQVTCMDGTIVIAEQNGKAQITAKEFLSGTRTVWIGNDANSLFYYDGIRTILRNAITWTIGYTIYKTYPNEIIMIMDDPGGSQNLYLDSWKYPELTDTEIRKYLVKPLKENNAILNINFVPAIVNEKKGRLEPSWTQQFTDDFGTKQDYVSSKKGFDYGISQGVFEVMCHGLTHMQPDLISAPGWYGADLDKEKAEVAWYREFGDVRRNKEIPAAEQRWRMETSRDWIIEQFGVVPLEFCPGGSAQSRTFFNNTCCLAGKLGFGWYGWGQGYLGTDMVIPDWKFSGKESPLIVGTLPNGHDYGITYAPEEFVKIFTKYPDSRFISVNEYIGYLHTQISGLWNTSEKLTVSLSYDTHYCRYFEDHKTTWNLEFANWLISEKGVPQIHIDGKETKLLTKTIDVDTGLGEHTIEIEFQK